VTLGLKCCEYFSLGWRFNHIYSHQTKQNDHIWYCTVQGSKNNSIFLCSPITVVKHFWVDCNYTHEVVTDFQWGLNFCTWNSYLLDIVETSVRHSGVILFIIIRAVLFFHYKSTLHRWSRICILGNIFYSFPNSMGEEYLCIFYSFHLEEGRNIILTLL
jgi:hypothetical protein